MKSGPTSTGGFSTGYVTVVTRTLSTDDEKLETLGHKRAKVYQLKDDPTTEEE